MNLGLEEKPHKAMFTQKENDLGYIVYVNKANGQTQLMDPNLSEILRTISKDCDHIKYAAYRCAAKLIALSKALFIYPIPYQSVIVVLERHRFHQTDNAPVIRPVQLTALLYDIFFAAEKLGTYRECVENFELSKTVGMVANLFWNLFDCNRNSPISLLEVKQTFLLLSHTVSYEQIIYEHFLLGCDHNRCVSRYRFEAMVKIMSKVFTFIDSASTQQLQYGLQLMPELVTECFQKCPGIVGLNEFQFYDLWRGCGGGGGAIKLTFTHFTNVYGLMRRMSDAELVVHQNTQCIACEMTPIRGLRFKCVHCRRFSLCFRCFSGGYSNRRHERSHRMYEISSNEIVQSRFRAFIQKLCSIFLRNESSTITRSDNMTMETNLIEIDDGNVLKDVSAGNVDVSDDVRYQTLRNCGSSTTTTTGTDKQCLMLSPTGSQQHMSTSIHSTGMEKLTAIIDLLVKETDKLSDWMQQREPETVPSQHDFLLHHRTVLTEVIVQLRDIWQRSISSILPHSSTPYRQTDKASNSGEVRNSLSASIKGMDINKSYLEANKSDLSLSDLSSWLHTRKPTESIRQKRDSLPTVSEHCANIDTDMSNFKDLLHIVKDIIDDSYSDNTELSKATNRLEKVLEDIIGEEERKRFQ